MNEILIDSSIMYDYCVARGYEPLIGYEKSINAVFKIPIELRRELQEKKFKSLDQFYKTAFELSNKTCEETGQWIRQYSAKNISHILSRGAHPAMAFDLRNFNLLTFSAHQQWEHGNRKAMKIYKRNQKKMEMLKFDYYGSGS